MPEFMNSGDLPPAAEFEDAAAEAIDPADIAPYDDGDGILCSDGEDVYDPAEDDVLSPATLDEALECANQTHSALVDIISEVDATLAAIPEDTKNQFEEAFAVHVAGMDHKLLFYERRAIRLDMMRHSPDPILPDAIAPHIDRLSEAIRTDEQARLAAIELALPAYEEIRETVASSVDWEAVIARYIAGDGYDTFSKSVTMALHDTVVSGGIPKWVVGATKLLRSFLAEAETRGDILPEDAREAQASLTAEPEQLQETAEWFRTTRLATRMLSHERHTALRNALGGHDQVFRKVATLYDHAAYDHEGRLDVGLPPALLHTLVATGQSMIDTIYSADAATRGHELPVLEANELTITNGEYVRDSYNVEPEDYTAGLLAMLPYALRRGLQAIEYYNNDMPVQGALGYVRGSEAKIVVRLNSDKGLWRPGWVFPHEAGHIAHYYAMPLAWLQRWITIVQTGKEGASPWIDARMKEDPKASLYAEELAYVAYMYTRMPRLLRGRSEARYAFFKDYCEAFGEQSPVPDN